MAYRSETRILQDFLGRLGIPTFCLPCRRSRVRIPSAALEKARICRAFSWAQSSSASASPDNDRTIVSAATRGRGRKVLFSRRFRATSTLELLRPRRGSRSTAPGRCSCPPAPLRLVRGRNAAFVEEQQTQPALPLVVRRASERRLGGDPRFSTGATFLPRSPRVQLAWGSGTLERVFSWRGAAAS
jgi:hypothetical protein